jgi:RND superfamily putative drug exporter
VRKLPLAARIAGFSARHRATAILGWLLFVGASTILTLAIGTLAADDLDHGVGESGRADRVIAEAGFPQRAGEMVLITSERLRADAPGFEAVVREVETAVLATGQVEGLRTPLDEDGAGLVSADQHSVLVVFEMIGDPETAADRVGPVLDAVASVQANHPDMYIAQGGGASADLAIGESLDRDLERLSLLSLPLTLGILVVAFGALLAAILPVGLAVTAIMAALGGLAVASRLFPTVDTTFHVMLLVGLAVGVDYCLFYIRREREEREHGADRERALAVAAATSGRSILISGLTVVVAMAGMFLTFNVVFVSFAVATILVVATAVLGSLTVLPAVLAKLGDRVDLGKVPGLYRRRSRGRIWRGILRVVLRRPAISALLSAAALATLAVPALGLRTASPGLDDFTGDDPIIDTFYRVQEAFPGGADPALVVVKAPDVTSASVQDAIEEFRAAALATGELHQPIEVVVNADRTVAVVSLGLAGTGGTDPVTDRALQTLREQVIPATLGRIGSADVAVTGSTASSADFTDSMNRTAPLVFVFVLALSFVLLLFSFRSMVVAITSTALNLLSVAAAYGLLVVVFQWGWGESMLGFTSTGSITDWIPLFLFVILFGLSMDYHVFVLSRIREGHDQGMPTVTAVSRGITGTAGAITSAAVVMVAVFSLFATMSLNTTKQLGVGLAAAILLDATIVRAVLLPSVMALLGERNWYLPRWLGWLPHLPHGEVAVPEPRPAAAKTPALRS